MSNITLRFTSFNTESGYDFVIISRCTSADCSTKEQVVRLSGSAVSLDTVYSSSTGFLLVEFLTDESVTRAGFQAEWQSTAATGTRDLGGGASTLSEVLESLLASDSKESLVQSRRNSHTRRAVESKGRRFGSFPATVAAMSGVASAALTKVTTVLSEPLRAAFNARSDVRKKPSHGNRADNFITGSITEQLSERLVSRKLLQASTCSAAELTSMNECVQNLALPASASTICNLYRAAFVCFPPCYCDEPALMQPVYDALECSVAKQVAILS